MQLLDASLLPIRNAALQGDVQAMFELGCIYGTGKEASPSDTEALSLFLKVIERKDELGHIWDYFSAMLFTGILYGRKGDMNQADYWFRKLLAEISQQPVNTWPSDIITTLQVYIGLI